MASPYKYQYGASEFLLHCTSWQHYDNSKLSKFDKFLREKWDSIMEAGHFNYTLDHVKERTLPGRQRFYMQLNAERTTLRRKPESFHSVTMSFNPDKFNFTKVKKEEIVCELEPEKTSQNGVKENIEGATKSRHLLIVNVSPMAYGHCLLVPDVDDQHYQHLTQKAHELAIHMILLSNHPGFHVGFNSLMALASVNHQHLHIWYLDQEMAIETAAAKKICPKFYEMVGMPTRAFIFQLEGSSVEEMARFGFTVTDYFIKNEVAHNVFLTRGAKIGGEGTTVRLVIWPRKGVTGAKFADSIPVFNLAVTELAGHLLVYIPEKFETLTEEEILDTVQDNLLSDQEFETHKNNLASLLQGIAS